MLGAQNGENDIDHGENELGIVGVLVLVFEWPKVLGFEGLFGMTFEDDFIELPDDLRKFKENPNAYIWEFELFNSQ